MWLALLCSSLVAVLMDCDMPGIDGCEAATRIRRIEAEQQLEPVPIIAITAYTDDDKRARATSAGIRSYVTKPFVVEDLETVLRNAATPS